MTLLDQLNAAQRQAVTTADGPLLIVAGPGSGKTRVIVHRVAHLVDDLGVAPFNILAVTFTNKAAREMRERLHELLSERRVRWLTVGTFHATCARWLRIDGHHLGLDPNFVIFDDGDQLDIAKQVIKELELDEQRTSPRAVLSAISSAKSELLSPSQLTDRAQTYWQHTVARVYEGYQRRLAASRALDFDDLLAVTVELFRANPGVLERYQDRFRYILVDEFQDTNVTQYELVRMLGVRHRNVCVVGDEDQSIYSWRKADARNLGRFEADFPERLVVTLEQNYRSTQTILDVAHAVIDVNEERKPKRLWTDNPRGQSVGLHLAFNEQDEALQVVRQVEALRRKGARYADFAVLYRTNAQSRAVEDAMVRYGLPYRLVGGTRFYQRREVKDILAYLRLVQNPADSVSLTRIINVPSRGLGAKSVGEITAWAERQQVSPYEAARIATAGTVAAALHATDRPPVLLTTRARKQLAGFVTMIEQARGSRDSTPLAELLDLIIDRSGYEHFLRDGSQEGDERWRNVQELRTKARDYDSLSPDRSLSAFLEEVALVQDVDSLDENTADAVTLITLHAAKGLEFRYAFILGLEEGLCPHSRSMDDPEQMAEERRLLYVGITRAMEGLYLLHTYRRTTFGSEAEAEPSRFLADIPPELLEATTDRRARDGAAQYPPRLPRRSDPFGFGNRRFSDSSRLGVAWRNPSLRRSRPSWTAEHPDADPELGVSEKPIIRRDPVHARTSPPPASSSLREHTFKRGERVQHADYGGGTVLVSTFAGVDELVLVQFDIRPEKAKNLSLAIHRLERA